MCAFMSITEKVLGSSNTDERKILVDDVNQIRQVIQTGEKDLKTKNVSLLGNTITANNGAKWIRRYGNTFQFYNGSSWQEPSTATLLTFTAGENIAARDVVYLKVSDGKIYKASTANNDWIGVATSAITSGASGTIYPNGSLVGGFSGLTSGTWYGLNATAGTLTANENYIVGLAISATQIILVKPKGDMSTRDNALYKLQGEKAINDVSATNSGVLAGSSQVLIDKFLDANGQNNTVDTGNTDCFRQFYVQDKLSNDLHIGGQFNSDGTKFYIIISSNRYLKEFNLSRPFDITSRDSGTVTINFGTQDSSPGNFIFNRTGTKLYMCGLNTDIIYQYDLSTAWLTSTASYTTNYNPSSTTSILTAIDFNSDESKLFIFSAGDNKLYQFTLSTPGLISSASYDGVFKSVVSNFKSVAFSRDGLAIYFGTINNTLICTILPAPYDISTSTTELSCVFKISGATSTNLYIGGAGGQNNYVYRFGEYGIGVTSIQTSSNYTYISTLNISSDYKTLTDEPYVYCQYDGSEFSDSTIQSVATTIPTGMTKVFVTPLMYEALATGDSITAYVSIDNGAHYTTGVPINTWTPITSANGTQLIVKANLLTGTGSTSPKISGWRVLME